jgi:hypothetical protein
MTSTLDSAPAVTQPTQRTDLDELRARLTGTLAEPHEASYDELVTPWNLAVPMRPAAVVAARTAEDSPRPWPSHAPPG